VRIHKEIFPFIENIWLWLKYFLFFPIFSLFPIPFPYFLSRYLSRVDYWYNFAKKKSIKKWMNELLDGAHFSRRELNLATRRYFEVIYCGEIDIYIYLLGFSKIFMRRLKIEGEQNLREALGDGGGILLSAHFGGGFWVIPFLKDLGIEAHFFSVDIKPEDYPFKKALYLYERLSNWVVERASGRRVLYKRERKRGLIGPLEEGKWVIVLFDVPPFLVREKMEVSFLGKKTWFPKGVISIGKEMDVPIVPFFSYLDKGNDRRVCFEKPIYVKDGGKCVEECVRLIEKRILERPDHWHLWPFAGQFFVQ
jgi:lauroyl/myristoyl acyltransferase